MKTLSDKWYNVIRRQVRATQITYQGPLPACPDCGSLTYPNKGRYGRFYRCIHYGCGGTHGARLDGTPRKRRPESEALVETRRVIRQLVLVEEQRAIARNDIDLDMCGLIRDLEKPARVGSAYVRYKSKQPCHHRFGTFEAILSIRRVEGLGLRYRSPAELEAIRRAAQQLIHQRRRNAWDHLVLDEVDRA